ncbi:MAG TPA: hypothetical protein VMS17_26365 [Gemmataceae bacterium]|nr:hypothetical protein [Gemmataceae bacterium]
MNTQPIQPAPDADRSGVHSLDSLNVIIEGNEDTTVRPMTPEQIEAMKRFWKRQGVEPPPPYDKL